MVKLADPIPGLAASTEVAEAAARRSLRAQVARLERELAACVATAFPGQALETGVAGPGGPRLLSLGELEATRDALAARLADARTELAARARTVERNRALLERMHLEPGRHKFVRVMHADLGQPGCGSWRVRPRLGLLGMLLGWWEVKLSSGCPLTG